MRLLFFVLNKTDKLDAVLTEFARNNISGATVLESVGMARVLSNNCSEEDIPLLASLRTFLNPERERNNVIFAVIQDDQLACVVNSIESVVGDLSAKDTGIVFSLPIDFVKGVFEIGK